MIHNSIALNSPYHGQLGTISLSESAPTSIISFIYLSSITHIVFNILYPSLCPHSFYPFFCCICYNLSSTILPFFHWCIDCPTYLVVLILLILFGLDFVQCFVIHMSFYFKIACNSLLTNLSLSTFCSVFYLFLYVTHDSFLFLYFAIMCLLYFSFTCILFFHLCSFIILCYPLLVSSLL